MNTTKIMIFALLILLLAGMVNAIDYTITEHNLHIQLTTEGQDKIEEKFYISFPNETAKITFRNKSLQLGTSLDNWKEFDATFNPSIIDNTLNKQISYNEGEQNYLLLSYDLADSFMAKGKETSMLIEYVIKVNYFNSFYQAGLWIIPDNTTITIELPPGAEVRETIEPEATITTQGTRKIISWQGYKSANKLSLNYVLWKKIDPLIDLNAFNSFLFRTQTGQIIIIAIILLIALIFWQRKKIAEGIEDFVEKNSLIKEE
jgi:hypothetical protein